MMKSIPRTFYSNTVGGFWKKLERLIKGYMQINSALSDVGNNGDLIETHSLFSSTKDRESILITWSWLIRSPSSSSLLPSTLFLSREEVSAARASTLLQYWLAPNAPDVVQKILLMRWLLKLVPSDMIFKFTSTVFHKNSMTLMVCPHKNQSLHMSLSNLRVGYSFFHPRSHASYQIES